MQSLSAKWIACSILFVFFLTAFTGSGLTSPAAHAITGNGSLTDPNIKYIGRWDISSRTVHTSNWTGAYFKTNFTGTTVQIKLAAPVNIYVLIDQRADTFYSAVSGTVNLTPTRLSPGIHSLRVAAYSEEDVIQFQGLILDRGAHTVAPTISSHLIEFVGDSITTGTTTSEEALTGYGWLTGEALSVEHVLTAHEGICLVNGVQCGVPKAAGMSAQFFKMQTVYFPNSPRWDFSRYQPDAVVINLGSNDNDYEVDDATFQSTYITFLHNIRAVYPYTEILVLRPFQGEKADSTQAAVQTINAAGDTRVRYIDTTGWISDSDLNDGVHPSDTGQIKVANRLAPILAPYVESASANASAIKVST